MILYNLAQGKTNKIKIIFSTKSLRKWKKYLGISKMDMERIVTFNSSGQKIIKVNCKHKKNSSKKVRNKRGPSNLKCFK